MSADGPTVFRRNREEVVWMIFVLVFSAAFALTSTTLLLARLTAESQLGVYDAPYDVVWAVLSVAMLSTLAYYLRLTWVFLSRRVTVDAEGLSVGAERIAWGELVAVREEISRRRWHVFQRVELERPDGSWVPVTSALIADYGAFVERVRRARPGVPWTVVGPDR